MNLYQKKSREFAGGKSARALVCAPWRIPESSFERAVVETTGRTLGGVPIEIHGRNPGKISECSLEGIPGGTPHIFCRNSWRISDKQHVGISGVT